MTRFNAIAARSKAGVLSIWSFMRTHPKSSIAGAVTLFGILLIIGFATRPEEPEYILEDARRGDLLQVVEAIGEVISERDLKLQFPITGIVDKVYVDEGDYVEAGTELARLRSSGLQADVNSAAAAAASAKAELDKLLEGTRPEEIAITEASVRNKRASLEAARESLRTSESNLESSKQKLEALKREAEASLSGFVFTARSDISKYLSTADQALAVIDDQFNDNRLLDVYVKHRPGDYRDAQDLYRVAQTRLNTFSAGIIRDYRDALDALQRTREIVTSTADVVAAVYADVSALPITPAYSSSVRSQIKSEIALELDSVRAASSSLDAAIKSLRDASANFDTRIAAEESAVVSAQGSRNRALADINTFETALTIEEANLSLQRAGARQADIAGARARLNQQYASLQRARERYDDTVIRAPIDGTITKVNLKEGELLSTAFASDTAITMLGESPYRIEMYVSEIDIPRVDVGQSGSIALDAFPDRDFDLIVSEVDPAATQVDGVSKYRVKLDFSEQDKGLKIGMTGDAEIYTDFREDVIIVPGRAVLRRNGNDIIRILTEDDGVEEREVRVGMDGAGGDTEIIAGVKEGESVVVLQK